MLKLFNQSECLKLAKHKFTLKICIGQTGDEFKIDFFHFHIGKMLHSELSSKPN